MTKAFPILAATALILVGLPTSPLRPAHADSITLRDVPANHWAYQSIDTLQRAGIVIGYPDGTYTGRRSMTRYQFAVAIARLLPLLPPDSSTSSSKDGLAAAKADLRSKLDQSPFALTALKQLVDGFAPELTALEQDVPAAKAQLDTLEAQNNELQANRLRVAAKTRFADVPAARANLNSLKADEIAFAQGKLGLHAYVDGSTLPLTDTNCDVVPDDHWAYNAVSTVQSTGILIGYPDVHKASL